ncbi:MAG: hypothetical protein NUK62_01020 [Tenericutes bacterium]|nr:hypothetical protein [Mycoplasmatota bacterium]
MKLSRVLQVKKSMQRKRIHSLMFIGSGILSIIFVLITFYGTQAGNFIMTVDHDAFKRGIVLSQSSEFEEPQARLMTRPVTEARDMTYSWLKIEEVLSTTGNYTDPDYDYVAYTFYLQNNGLETVDIIYHIRITEVYKNMDDAIRVLVIEEGEETIYQKPDKKAGGVLISYPLELQETKHFLSDTIITRKKFENFRPGQTKKYSVLMWIEGTDPDTTDDVLGGMVKLQMNFSIENP